MFGAMDFNRGMNDMVLSGLQGLAQCFCFIFISLSLPSCSRILDNVARCPGKEVIDKVAVAMLIPENNLCAHYPSTFCYLSSRAIENRIPVFNPIVLSFVQ